MNAADFGVPKKRNRLFIIGSLHGRHINAPTAITKKPVTVSQAFKDLPILENGHNQDEKEYSSAARTTYAKSLRGLLLISILVSYLPQVVSKNREYCVLMSDLDVFRGHLCVNFRQSEAGN